MDPQKPNDTSPQKENKKPDESGPTLAQPLQTFQSDVERYIRENNVSKREAAAALKMTGRTPAPKTSKPEMLPPAPVAPPPPINPRAAILPTHEVHSPMNASRVDASVLLEQEATATLPKVSAPPLPIPQKPKTATPPVETYQGDVQQYVREKNISSVTVAAAEEQRRSAAAAPIVVANTVRTLTEKITLTLAGLVLIGAALGALAYVYITHQALPAQLAPQAPFISVDQTTQVPLSGGSTRSDILQALVQAKGNVKLSLGLVAQLVPTISTTTGQTPIDAQTLFAVFTPNMPAQLLRSLQPNFLLGVHSFDVNQPFLILSVDSYEDGYAGMLAWESTMHQDLSPLFDYTPSPTIQNEPTDASVNSINPATLNTSTPQTAQSQATSTPAAPAVIQTGFVDTIVDNHDARAIENSAGQIELLWTFLDRNIILITTNPNTVTEVISRQKSAPTISIPGQ